MRSVCGECGHAWDGTDHNAQCLLERVADVLDEFGYADEPNTRERDFEWAAIILDIVKTGAQERPAAPAPRGFWRTLIAYVANREAN